METQLILLLCLLTLGSYNYAAGSAPGDEHRLCTTGPHTKSYPENQQVLLDSYNYFSLITGFYPRPVWLSNRIGGTGNGWTEIIGGGACRHQVYTCDHQSGQTVNNWLFTQYILFTDANEVFVEVTYNLSPCQFESSCTRSFIKLYSYLTPQANIIQQANTQNYQLLRQLDQPPNSQDDQQVTVRVAKPTGLTTSMGFYLAFYDTGTCGTIKHVRVYYKVCPARHIGVAAYPSLPLPAQGSSTPAIAHAFCAPNSVAPLSSGYIAHGDGRCSYEANCTCRLGYEEVNMTQLGITYSTCQICPQGTYRSMQDTSCQPCPSNTVTSGVGVAQCPCVENFYRASNEGPGVRCTSPPSACRNIRVIATSHNQITIRWYRPTITGRNDYYYNVYRTNCANSSAQLIQQNQRPLTAYGYTVSYTVTGLNPFTSYTFRVTVHNGVSDQDLEGRNARMCEVTAEALPNQLTLLDIMSGIAVWNATDNSGTQYKIRYNRRVGESNRNIRSVPISYNLDETTRYNVQVQTLNDNGDESWCEPLALHFEDIDECATRTHNCAHNCHNTDKGYYCTCRNGYTLNSDGRTCSDSHATLLESDNINECSFHACDHHCRNTIGSYRCNCRHGYTLSRDRHTCLDINECTAGTDRCQHNCQNTAGSYTCSCRSGYILNNDGRTCRDINECSTGTHQCQHNCHNNVGSYRCSCRSGYRLSNGRSCRAIISTTQTQLGVNGFDHVLDLSCPSKKAISRVVSEHHSGYEDRWYELYCRQVVPSDFTNCYWTGFVNDYDQGIMYQCPSNYALTGMYSVHSNYHEDRKWKFRCCRHPDYCTTNCRITGFLNNMDHRLAFGVSSGQVFSGAYSWHSNYNEDRQWKYSYCTYSQC